MEFRRVITVLAVVLVFASLASAQVNLTCTSTTGSVPTQIRTEGVTELVGDIVLSCSGGTPLSAGTIGQFANITVFTTSPITSRALGTAGATEALLLIDDPSAQVVCSTPATGAVAAPLPTPVRVSPLGLRTRSPAF